PDSKQEFVDHVKSCSVRDLIPLHVSWQLVVQPPREPCNYLIFFCQIRLYPLLFILLSEHVLCVYKNLELIYTHNAFYPRKGRQRCTLRHVMPL
ncbi:hypothetical protein SFRURICE_015911, partial [Spodoptera frugiperda]